MSFVAPYDSSFGQPIPANVIALTKAQQIDALKWANGGKALPSFIDFRQARPRDDKDLHFPCITVYKRGVKGIDEREAEASLVSAPEFAVELALEGDNEGELQARLELYVKAVDAMLRGARYNLESSALLFANFPDSLRGYVKASVTEHAYGKQEPGGRKYVQAAALTLVVSLKEDRNAGN